MGITMVTGGPRDQTLAPDATFLGYHQFRDTDGSFEVFYLDCSDHEPDDPNPFDAQGYYWHACHPGCLPDGEPAGPFKYAETAYLDAIGEP